MTRLKFCRRLNLKYYCVLLFSFRFFDVDKRIPALHFLFIFSPLLFMKFQFPTLELNFPRIKYLFPAFNIRRTVYSTFSWISRQFQIFHFTNSARWWKMQERALEPLVESQIVLNAGTDSENIMSLSVWPSIKIFLVESPFTSLPSQCATRTTSSKCAYVSGGVVSSESDSRYRR